MNLLRNDALPPERWVDLSSTRPSPSRQAPQQSEATAVLIVTNFPERFVSLGTDTVILRTCHPALDRLKTDRFAAVFCDIGQLGPDENGFRFALMVKDLRQAPPLYLMADEVTLTDETYALRLGAKGLVLRTAIALRSALSVQPQRAPSRFAPIAPANAVTNLNKKPISGHELERVKSALRRYIGPVADDMVSKTLTSLARRYPEGVPYESLVNAVSHYIEDSRQADRFLIAMGL